MRQGDQASFGVLFGKLFCQKLQILTRSKRRWICHLLRTVQQHMSSQATEKADVVQPTEATRVTPTSLPASPVLESDGKERDPEPQPLVAGTGVSLDRSDQPLEAAEVLPASTSANPTEEGQGSEENASADDESNSDPFDEGSEETEASSDESDHSSEDGTDSDSATSATSQSSVVLARSESEVQTEQTADTES